ncbi:MAG: serine/threonine protein kinase [Desulfobacterales bacterium]|nr:serine/threonine protein kinase [Desulfobacterales bacterium]MDD4073088.1 serine/threonine protein kinase [Desulfobacterales bacterium]MDD4393492.1 serine/threonine protein kinase [Desulfobacterales bacterium]
MNFTELTPEIIFNSAEMATGKSMSGLIYPLPSYINRVYELQDTDGCRLIAKFYRSGRWTYEALVDEHLFIQDCLEDELPVIAARTLTNGSTLFQLNGLYFSIFPKRFGRQFEVKSDEDWKRIGRLVARIHIAGCRRSADSRVKLNPRISTAQDIDHLIDGGFIPPSHRDAFKDITQKILDEISSRFDDIETIRLHGDCHPGNLLEHPDEGIRIIDFDDMMIGPPVHDIWLLLPGRQNQCDQEIRLILQGYEQFREFDRKTLGLIEPLRAMRIIYFLAWCSRQKEDFKFKDTFPDWGSPNFWQRETSDLIRQYHAIIEHNSNLGGNRIVIP